MDSDAIWPVWILKASLPFLFGIISRSPPRPMRLKFVLGAVFGWTGGFLRLRIQRWANFWSQADRPSWRDMPRSKRTHRCLDSGTVDTISVPKVPNNSGHAAYSEIHTRILDFIEDHSMFFNWYFMGITSKKMPMSLDTLGLLIWLLYHFDIERKHYQSSWKSRGCQVIGSSWR